MTKQTTIVVTGALRVKTLGVRSLGVPLFRKNTVIIREGDEGTAQTASFMEFVERDNLICNSPGVRLKKKAPFYRSDSIST